MNKKQRREYNRAYYHAHRKDLTAAKAAKRAAEKAEARAFMPRVGDPVAVKELHGKIIDVNEAHRHYTAEAECNGYLLRESFKFWGGGLT